MNGTAENSVNRKLFREMNDLVLESSDGAYRVLDSFLSVGAERPVTEAEPAEHHLHTPDDFVELILAKLRIRFAEIRPV